MRWNDRTERLVRDALDQDSCPLCGGRVADKVTQFPGGMRLIETVCHSCGMVVGGDAGRGWDGEGI